MQNHKPWWTITAKASDAIEILIYSMIGEDFWSGEGLTAKQFADDLKAAGAGIRKINLRINSPGGEVMAGLAIYNILRGHGAKISATVDGLAASIASVILMAADEIAMAENSFLMLHNPATMIAGDAPRMRKTADTLDKVKASMIAAYSRHTTKSGAEIGAILDAETWYNAAEAVANGFAEEVVAPEGDEADVAAHFDLSHFRHVPQQIAAMFGRQPRGSTSRQRTPQSSDDRRARLHEQTLELHAADLADLAASEVCKPTTRAQRVAVMRQRKVELDALARKVRADALRQHKIELDESALAESRKPRTSEHQRRAVMRQREIELGRVTAQRWPGMS